MTPFFRIPTYPSRLLQAHKGRSVSVEPKVRHAKVRLQPGLCFHTLRQKLGKQLQFDSTYRKLSVHPKVLTSDGTSIERGLCPLIKPLDCFLVTKGPSCTLFLVPRSDARSSLLLYSESYMTRSDSLLKSVQNVVITAIFK